MEERKEKNKIFLIGNGFDLSCGLETGYQHFLCTMDRCYFIPNYSYQKPYSCSLTDGELDIVKKGLFLKQIMERTNLSVFKKKMSFNHSVYPNQTLSYHLNISDKPDKLESNKENWVDIEQEYYRQLLVCKDNLLSGKDKEIEDLKASGIKDLNDSFSVITKLLEIYLSNHYDLMKKNKIKRIEDDFKNSYKKLFFGHNKELSEDEKDKTFFINFNYTNTLLDLNIGIEEKQVIHIHGKLNDPNHPIIFGYGDEMHPEYKDIENLNDNNFLLYFKSFYYSLTKHYEQLINIINSAPFDIYIVGHSCGLSDRVLLNTLFEHNHCEEIHISYYSPDGKEESGKIDYQNKYRNISRHFNDKHKMREKTHHFETMKTNNMCIPQL